MLSNLLTELLMPLVRRLGSMGAGALVAYGATHENAALIEEAAIAAGLVAIDLLVSHLNRKKVKDDRS